MEKQNLLRGRAVNVDVIRTVAIIAVILLHATGTYLISSQELSQMTPLDTIRWSFVDVYQTLARLGVPLFIMLTGALLLQPEKNESLRAFWKKRWARIGLPFLFWGVAYFIWDFLVIGIPFTTKAILQGVLHGPYSQFWYLYVLIGLYLLTPILRIFVAHANQRLIQYFVIIWAMAVSILPFFTLLTTYELSTDVFTITGFVGYFVLGTYMLSVQARRRTLWILTLLGIALTALGTYVLAVTDAGSSMYFFQQYFSPTILLASVPLFLLLLTVKPPAAPMNNKPSIGTKLLRAISENTLAIFLVHVMILETIQNGYLGFALNRNVLNPIVEVPLMTTIVLFLSLAVILLLKKVPYLKKLVG